MANGNLLDDDLTEDSVEYETTVDGVKGFSLPIHGFSTPSQKKWADDVTKQLPALIAEVRTLRTQNENANRLAAETSSVIASLISDTSTENDVPLNTPSAPRAVSRLGNIEIFWDGTDFEGTPMGSALAGVNVYAVKTEDLPENPDFDLVLPYDDGNIPPEIPEEDPMPDDGREGEEPEDTDPTIWPPKPIGMLPPAIDGGNVVFSDLEYNTEYTIWFIAKDVVGNMTPASDRIQQTVIPLVDTDVIGRVIDAANIELGAINEDLLSEGVKDRLDKAEQDSENAIEAANGKNTIYYNNIDTPPVAPGGGFVVGDTWFARIPFGTGEVFIMRWDGTDWVSDVQFGTTSIADASITNAKIANLDASKITTGFLDADRLEANSIVGGKIVAGSIAGDRIAGNTITGDKITGNTITGDKIAALTIEAGNINSNAITGDKISAGAIDGKIITGATVRTDASGQRVQLDSVGLRSFDSSDNVTASLTSATGGLQLSGSLTSASGNYSAVYGSGSITFRRTDGALTEATDISANLISSLDSNGSLVVSKTNSSPGVGLILSAGGAPSQTASVEVYGSGRRILLNGYVEKPYSQETLWSGAWFLSNTQTITLPKPLSSYENGIVLAWSAYYNGAPANWDWYYQYIPKNHYSIHGSQVMKQILLSGGPASNTVTVKEVSMPNASAIVGAAANTVSTATNFVLRYVRSW